MTTGSTSIAQAISGQRFTEASPHLAPGIRWVPVGSAIGSALGPQWGPQSSQTAEMAGGSTEFRRFLVVIDDDTDVIDAVGRYVDAAGGVSAVSSCGIDEFDQRVLPTITSYTVELPAE